MDSRVIDAVARIARRLGSRRLRKRSPRAPRKPGAGAGNGPQLVYAPDLDGRADPGEIVWTWVAYEDDAARGKDRPVLVVGRKGSTLLGLMLSSRGEHDGERNWLGLGTGDWDRDGRPSWVRLDRVLQLPDDSVRREGAVLDRRRFERVATALRRDHGWG